MRTPSAISPACANTPRSPPTWSPTWRRSRRRSPEARDERTRDAPAARAGADAEVAGAHLWRDAHCGSSHMDVSLLRSGGTGGLVELGGVPPVAARRGEVRR